MKYGISTLSVIPMRIKDCDKSEMINQILFGEHFKILKIKKNWSLVCLSHDNYKGWICNKQWSEISEENYITIQKETPTITTDLIDIIRKDTTQTIIIGSILPSYKSGYAIIGEKMYQFEGLSTQGFSERNKIIENAKIYINTPYLWGGRTPFGIDCSGLTQMVYRLNGISIPRDAYQQAEIGKEINSIKNSKKGDLAFFKNHLDNKITHVGIILENNQVIHASGKVRIDTLDDKGIFNNNSNKYTHSLECIKHIT